MTPTPTVSRSRGYEVDGFPSPSGRFALSSLLALSLASVSLFTGCEMRKGEAELLPGQAVKITFIHSTDWHSRLVPYHYQPNRTDRQLGIDERYAPFGGIARMAWLIKRERAKGYRVLHLDSGDVFQGAPIFNFFGGEVEIRALSMLAPDAHTLGNHDFDLGARNVWDQHLKYSRYPVLASNYVFLGKDNPRGIYLSERVRPFVILNSHGLKVGVIGLANISSMTSVGEGGNSLGIQPLEEVEILQSWIDFLEPQVDLVVLLSHAGLSEDERIIRESRGLDLAFGGHHHVVLNPPKIVLDKVGREVPLIHSGGFLKVFCALDVVVKDGNVVSTNYRITPVDSRIPEEREALELLEPYLVSMNREVDLQRVLAFAPKTIPRYGNKTGDSALGNLVTEAMRERQGVETDFSLSNSLGIRADFSPGPITQELLFNVFPFENTVTKMMLSGKEIVEMLDFVAQRSANRGCNSQAQVDNLRFTMHCLLDEPTGSWADQIWVGNELVVGERSCVKDKDNITPLSFDVAVNDYIARGGSGFKMLKANTSKVPTGIPIRTVVGDFLRKLPSCGTYCADGDTDPESCALVRNCIEDMAEYYSDSCRVPWTKCSSDSDCRGGRECVEGACRVCEDGDCSGILATPECRSDEDCGPGEVCNPLRVNEGLTDQDVLYCYRAECWESAKERDPTRIPFYCRADVDPDCVEEQRTRAASECPRLPCVMVEEDGRIRKVTGTLSELPESCLAEVEETAQPMEVDRCATEGICWE